MGDDNTIASCEAHLPTYSSEGAIEQPRTSNHSGAVHLGKMTVWMGAKMEQISVGGVAVPMIEESLAEGRIALTKI